MSDPGTVSSSNADHGEPLAEAHESGDHFERLWTPHRMVYVDGPSKIRSSAPEECPFCTAPRLEDSDALIVHRGLHNFVVLNLFPYNPGHLLVCTYRHVPDLPQMTVVERAEAIELMSTAMEVISRVKHPAGFNLGMNAGQVAGAGIAGHAHLHVVPRWEGDANFLPIIGATKAVPELLAETQRILHEEWSHHGTR